jgi:hypothetical protein
VVVGLFILVKMAREDWATMTVKWFIAYALYAYFAAFLLIGAG